MLNQRGTGGTTTVLMPLKLVLRECELRTVELREVGQGVDRKIERILDSALGLRVDFV
jgi:hypothetical protein